MHGRAVARSWAPTFRPRSRAPEHGSLSPRPRATPHPSPLPAGTWGGRNTRDHSAVGSCNPHRGAHPSARALPLGLSCSFSAVTLTLLSVATGHFCCNVRVSEPAAISFSFLLFLGVGLSPDAALTRNRVFWGSEALAPLEGNTSRALPGRPIGVGAGPAGDAATGCWSPKVTVFRRHAYCPERVFTESSLLTLNRTNHRTWSGSASLSPALSSPASEEPSAPRALGESVEVSSSAPRCALSPKTPLAGSGRLQHPIPSPRALPLAPPDSPLLGGWVLQTVGSCAPACTARLESRPRGLPCLPPGDNARCSHLRIDTFSREVVTSPSGCSNRLCF